MMIESSGIMEDAVNYSYDEDNKRTHKDNTSDDKYSLTFNDYYSIYFSHHNHTGELYNNIMLGQTRLAIEIFNKENLTNPNRTYFFHSDHLGSTTLITDNNGAIYQYTEYTPYGEVWAEVTENKTYEHYYFDASYRFTGKPRDEETGYYYFGARYFDPYLNIWTTSDPAISDYFDDTQKGEGGVFNHINLNAYHYGGNNPIKYVDPDGEFALPLFGAAFGTISGIVGQAVSDIISGKLSSFSTYTGAAVGGAVTGAILATTVNPVLAGTVGAAAGNAVKQGVANAIGEQKGFDAVNFVADTVAGALTGLVCGPLNKTFTQVTGFTSEMAKGIVKEGGKITGSFALDVAISRGYQGGLLPGCVLAPFVSAGVETDLNSKISSFEQLNKPCDAIDNTDDGW